MNSLTANARKVEIGILESQKRDLLMLRIRDDGRGMDAATLARVLDTRWSSKRQRRKSIGLGLAFLRQAAEMCDGRFQARSTPGHGTAITASMRLSHVDRPPLGDVNATILALCSADPAVEVRLDYRSDKEKFSFSSRELITKGEARR